MTTSTCSDTYRSPWNLGTDKQFPALTINGKVHRPYKKGTGASASFVVLIDKDTEDTDGDGVDNRLDAFPFNSAENKDTDRDGIGNKADTDDDNDGVLDTADNCPLAANADQTNLDKETQINPDELGDVCDDDDDGDGIDDDEDVDDDNDGLIEIHDLTMLYNMRHNLTGTRYDEEAG